MKTAILDTDILSYFLKGDKAIAKKLIEYSKSIDKILLTIISYYEIRSGLEYKDANAQMMKFDDFINKKCVLLELTKSSIDVSAKQYAKLRKKGVTIGTADLFIAGIAMSNNFTLITNNTKHYKEIDGLEIINWLE